MIVVIKPGETMKLEKIARDELTASFVGFARTDDELVMIKNWSGGEYRITLAELTASGRIKKTADTIFNDDKRTADGFVVEGRDIIVFESGKKYSGVMQFYGKGKDGRLTKTHSYPTLNFIEEPSIKNGLLMGTEFHDTHGFLVSLYDFNHAPKNLMTKKLPDVMSNLVWMPKTDNIAAELHNNIVLYHFDEETSDIKVMYQTATEHLNVQLRELGSKTDIRSIIPTKDNELLIGFESKMSTFDKGRHYVALTTSLGNDMKVVLQGDPCEVKPFETMSLSPSGNRLLTYSRSEKDVCRIYSLVR